VPPVPAQDVPLLAQDLVLPPQPLQLRCHILLAVLGRRLDLTLAAAIDPVAQGRKPDPEILGILAPALISARRTASS
jgi:hypothetical protein